MFALDEPLRRLTSAPAFRRRFTGGRGARHNNPPDLYDLEAHADASNPKRPRWTEPGTWMRENQAAPAPDQTVVRRPNRGPAPQQPHYGPQGPQGPQGPTGPEGEPNRSGDSANLRWNLPDWLEQSPPPFDAPPLDAAPPTTPRYSGGEQSAPRYQVSEFDPKHNTDYRSTSVRSALWASRTPGYQPDQPPVMPEHDAASDHIYFESYDTKREPASFAHAGASMSATQTQSYSPGQVSEVEQLRREQQNQRGTNGPAPYFWEMSSKPKPASPAGIMAFWLVSLLLVFSALLTSAYSGVSIYAASQLVYAPQQALKGTPAQDGLAFKEVEFPARTDHLELRGWFIPGVSSPGQLTTRNTIIVVHGMRTNRTDQGVGLLNLSDALAKAGFAVLAFDMRGSGESSSAPTSLGYFEQRDVLGAVDFLKNGQMPYPNLGRPKAIGGLGVSMGAATLLLAAAQEPSIRAVVSDSAYADAMPLLEREIPLRGHLPGVFTPGVLEAAQVMYGIDYSAVKPEAVVARIAPRPILFIHGSADTFVPPGNVDTLAQAAQQGSGARVQTWLVPNAKHAQAYHVAGQAYIAKVVAFFTASLASAG